ncbi:hypothetical protein [Phage f2b1]|nr:hypothetical protein [Phage f2b1]
MIDLLGNIFIVIILCTFIVNLFGVSKKTKLLKQKGEDPLVPLSLTLVVVAALAEYALITLLITAVFDWGNVQVKLVPVVIVFAAGYVLRNVAAWLSAWGVVSIYTYAERRKMKKQIMEDKETAL